MLVIQFKKNIYVLVKESTSFYKQHVDVLKNEYGLKIYDFENEVEGSVPQEDFIAVYHSHFKTLLDSLKHIHSNRNIKLIYITRPYSKTPFECQTGDVERFEYEMSKIGVDKYIRSANVNKNVENLWEWIVSEEVPELKRR